MFIIGLSHIRVSTHVSTAYRDTKDTSHVRRRYVDVYVAHTLRYVAHTPHTPRCYVFYVCT